MNVVIVTDEKCLPCHRLFFLFAGKVNQIPVKTLHFPETNPLTVRSKSRRGP